MRQDVANGGTIVPMREDDFARAQNLTKAETALDLLREVDINPEDEADAPVHVAKEAAVATASKLVEEIRSRVNVEQEMQR